MGLASFNRMRRSRMAVSMMEAERAQAAHDSRSAVRQHRIETHRENKARVPEIREAELAAMQVVGEKARAGIDNNDMPLRQDHADEIASRDLKGVQTPKTEMQRVQERLGKRGAQVPAGEGGQTAAKPAGGTGARRGARKQPAGVSREDQLATRSTVEIPANWRDLHWREKRKLAASVSDTPVYDKADADAAIEQELRRRG